MAEPRDRSSSPAAPRGPFVPSPTGRG